MLPRDLKPDQFAGYPPEARKLMVSHLDILRQLPLSFLPSLLREAIEYDYRFPAERSDLDRELASLNALSPTQLSDRFEPFAKVSVSPALVEFDWINQPAQFVEQQSAYLWSTHQLDAFRKAAMDYGAALQAATPAEPPPVRRLGIALIGQGVSSYDGKLFPNLRAHGTYFSHVNPETGFDLLVAAVENRATEHPVPYGHWYVDGGQLAAHGSSITAVSYNSLEPVRATLLKRMQAEIAVPGMGPEELRTRMARLVPADLGMDKNGDAVVDRFKVKLLTEGSGTQIYATTFAQWTTREVLRRTQAVTLLVRFAPRQRQRPLNELIAAARGNTELDPLGSLIDADMGAYYHWINQQRLPGSERSSFLAWFEGHKEAMAIGPSFPKGTESSSEIDLRELVSLATT
jgi:hypothetical protein